MGIAMLIGRFTGGNKNNAPHKRLCRPRQHKSGYNKQHNGTQEFIILHIILQAGELKDIGQAGINKRPIRGICVLPLPVYVKANSRLIVEYKRPRHFAPRLPIVGGEVSKVLHIKIGNKKRGRFRTAIRVFSAQIQVVAELQSEKDF
jgi:hypothetical protein